MAHIWAHRPQYVALEQVPTVLPVWEAMADVLRGLGYSVWTGNLQAEQYGVPQTRKRAILMAMLDGEVAPPEPTHSRYYSHDPQRLDANVQKWVSMGEALGLDGFTAEKVMGRGMVERFGTRPGRDATEPAFTIRASAGGAEPGGFVLVSNYGTGGDPSARGIRTSDMPAPTITSKADRNKWNGVRKMTAAEAATLQTFPEGFEFQGGRGKQFLQIGNAVPPRLANAIVSALVGVQVPRDAELVGAVA
ncbi:DNA cytosine methyltransferase [Microbacterium oxydans]|nr:DNA cytosine methyltransferase [Microbacterium oxydans]